MQINELKSLFENFCKKKSPLKQKDLFGIEYENFVLIQRKDNKSNYFEPISFEGDSGIFRVLENLVDLTKDSDDPLEKVFEDNMLLSLKRSSGAKITIEPGGQIELSDIPRNSLLDAHQNLQTHIKLLKKAISNVNGNLLFQGVQPLHSLEKIPFSPKRRYQIMYPHMLKEGSLGQWMMKASSGIQTSIDYNSIEDLQRKFVFLNRLSPFLTAIFANSPIVEGRRSGYLSYRSHIWENTDNKRSGLTKEFLDEKFVIEDYITWALRACPYHLNHNGKEIITTNWSFKELLDGHSPSLKPTIHHWEEHLGMLFPDVRIKNIIEVRTIDSISPKFSIAVPALIASLIYNESVFSSIQSVIMDLPTEDFTIYKKAAAKKGLKAEVKRANFKKTAIYIFEKAIEGLGSEEEDWLIPFFENYTKEGLTPAEETLEVFESSGDDPNIWIKTILNMENY